MTFEWKRDRNPYRYNSFGILQLGPFRKANVVIEHRDAAKLEIKGGRQRLIDGNPIDEHAIGESSKRLRAPRTLAEELLLVHDEVADDRRRRKRLLKDLQEVATPETTPEPLRFRSPLGVFWLTPLPGLETVPPPVWEELGLTEADDPADLALDIVFDG